MIYSNRVNCNISTASAHKTNQISTPTNTKAQYKTLSVRQYNKRVKNRAKKWPIRVKSRLLHCCANLRLDAVNGAAVNATSFTRACEQSLMI